MESIEKMEAALRVAINQKIAEGWKIIPKSFFGTNKCGCPISTLLEDDHLGGGYVNRAAQILNVSGDIIWAFIIGFDLPHKEYSHSNNLAEIEAHKLGVKFRAEFAPKTNISYA